MSDRDGAFKKAVGVSAAVGVLYAAWIVLGIGGERATQIFDDLYAVAVAIGAGAVIWRISKDLPSRDGWRLISLSVLSWGSGEAIWSYYEIPLHMDVPFPSLADVGYLASVPLAALGLFRLAGPMRSWAGHLKNALDGLTIGGSLLGLSWMLVLGGMYADTTASTFEKVIGLAYPLGDVVLITASILLFLRADVQQRASIALLSLGFVATAFSDTAFALMTLNDDYGAGDIVGIGWLFSFLLIGLAAVRATGPSVTGSESVSRRKAFLPYVPMGLLLVSIVAGQMRGEMTDPVPFWSLMAVIVAVTIRQLLAILENVALNKSLESQVASRTAELSAREERFRALVTNSSDVVGVLDRSLRITYVTAASNPVLGLDPGVLHLLPLLDLVHPNDRHKVTGAIGEALSQGGLPVAVDGKIQHGNGGWRYAQMMITSLLDDPAVQGIVVNIRDMTDRKELEDQLREMALHDPLTGLPNRVLFADRVEHAVSRTPREGGSHAVVLIDLDGFKQINDGLGHAAGDHVLREVGRRFGSVVRAPDTLARLGGDEFALLVEQVHPSKAEEIFHRLDSVLSRPIMIEGRETYVTMSAGIAIAAGERVDELLRNADVAMYTAKSKGTGGFEVYQAAMHERVMRRLEIEAELRKAIMSDSLEIHYQPVVSTGDHEIRAVEALVRWNHPVEGSCPLSSSSDSQKRPGL